MTTSTNLAEILTRWPDLEQALDARGLAEWPPAGRMTDYLNALDRTLVAQIRAEERSPDQIGETRAPLRIDILDTMRLVETTLVHIADTIAADIQRAPMPGAPHDWQARGWHGEDVWRRDQNARADAANAARWRYVGLRTAPYAAGWLLARWDGITGHLPDRPAIPSPFRPLTELHRAQITAVAAGCRTRIDTALGLHTREDEHGQPCPDCGGPIRLRTGAGAPPMARCGGSCQRLWTMADTAAA